MRLIVGLLASLIASSALAQGINNPSVVTNANLAQNGGMVIDQANEAAALTITTGAGGLRMVDRWFGVFVTSTSSAGNPSSQQQTASSGFPLGIGFSKSILLTASGTPSTTVPAALGLRYQHPIEGSDIADLGFGTTSAKAVTVSIWMKSSIANANYGVALSNAAVNRTYPHICNVPSAATWTLCTFTVPGDTTGTWTATPGTIGMYVMVAIAGGSTFQGTADTWNAAFSITSSAQTQFTATASATLEITGVKAERGSVATQFVSDPTPVLLTKLQRYYRKSFPPGTAPATSAGVAGATCVQNPIAIGEPSTYIALNPTMYATPTITTFNPSANNANWRDVTAAGDITVSVDSVSAKSPTGFIIQTAGTVTALADVLCIHYTAVAAGM